MDVIIENGLVFDGQGNAPRQRHVGIQGGTIATLSEAPIPRAPHTRVIDARGHWVTPGFIDLHTHYDAEVELAPSLSESVRHGVTTVVMGSCSLSLAVGTPEDLADMFCRVEAIPYATVRSLLEERKTWDTLGGYLEHLGQLPLGPNVASFLGHSALRAHTLGLRRSLEPGVTPTKDELRRLESLVSEGLDLGYLGLSIMTLKWDKMGGDRDIRSRPLPSTYARWSEYRRLTRLLRERGRIFQGVPNISTKVNVLLFLLESMGLWRKTLKTTVISMMDPRASRGIHRLIGVLSQVANRLFGADFRWQALPEVFDLWADGIDLVVFEEFGAGAAALHLQDAAKRADLLNDTAYRTRFRGQWTNKFLPRAFHRDFNESRILLCPDASVVGKSFAQVAKEQGRDAVDVFLDLVARHGDALRWYTVMANDRLGELERICKHPDVLMGFSDAGAHLRNMAHYNFPLRLLRLVREAEKRGAPFMTVERAVHRLTGEIGAWLGLDAGVVAEGRRADLVVVNPEGLDEKLDEIAEAPMENFGGFVRLVRRNDAAVKSVLIAGREAVSEGAVSPALGRERGFGSVLRAQA
ncbi:amidohydrolase family protein [Myxococcus sp. K15C18031901]|uniref:N-acyl-D-amino-acid deacylase family protein n=1 Tax=Myxococcus dinghuensis TaxID=2906761 RepID=UPI0020A77F3B|nr:amidohydrolase family protein [Myxococcus dinghuensis]MCP3104970.1 amidohydrolase family protein [Myxococcus dinghuensis]